MAEKLNQQDERVGEIDKTNLEAERKANLERLQELAEREANNAEAQPDVTEAHKEAQEKAISSKETTIDKAPKEHQQPGLGVQKQLKADAYKSTMKKVRKDLNPVERTFSKTIHHPVLETISEVSSKTIARPSAILGGGLTALLGSSAILIMSKYYGFPYNTFTFFLLFVIGFGVGLILEQFVRLLRRKKQVE